MAPDQGTLYVQVRLRGGIGQLEPASIKEKVRSFLVRCYSNIPIGRVHVQPTSDLAALVDRIEVTSHSKSTVIPDLKAYALTQCEMDITIYTLHADEDNDINADADDESPSAPFTVTRLPHQAFDGQWERLIYDEPVGELLLRVFSRAIDEFHNDTSGLAQSAWSNTALFHGPPGSGETSLAQALAQQLSLRLANTYTCTKLLQVDSSAIFSHMYGETPKAVGSLFSTICRLAGENEASMFIVIIDEIDKLVPSRKKISRKNEAQDTIRATAEVLTGLDKLRKSINVVWLFTTNIVEDLDPAFIDRCRLIEEINAPVVNCIFEMLREDINTKIRRGRIVLNTMIYDHQYDTIMIQSGEDSPHCSEQLQELPSLVWATRYWPSTATTTVTILHQIAASAAGLSGRTLRGLLDVAFFKYIVNDKPELRQVLEVLEVVVRNEATQRCRAAVDNEKVEASLPSGLTDESDVEFVTHLPIETNNYSDDE